MSSANQPPQIHNTNVYVQGPAQSQALPAVVSFFLPGVGQLVQGRFLAFFVFQIMAGISLLLCLVVVGFVLYPLVCIVSALDAAKYVPSTAQQRRKGSGCLALFVVGIVAVFLVVGVSSLMDERVPRKQGTRQVPSPSRREPSAEPTRQDDPSTALRRVGGQGMADFYVAGEKLANDPALLEARLREIADQKGTSFCQLMVWADPALAPKGFPMTHDQVHAQIAQYNRNKSTGYDRFMGPHEFALTNEFEWDDEAEIVEEPQLEETVEPALRTWTDATGDYSVEAEFAGMAFGKVKLRRESGQVIEIPMERLSEECQQWIRERGR